MKLFIQIGAARTATTYLQTTFYGQHPEVMYFPHRSVWHRWLFNIQLADKKVAAICDESLTAMADCKIEDVCQRLYALFPNAEIIIVTRSISVGLIRSFYTQMIKCGESRTFRDYIRSVQGERLRQMYDYKRIWDVYSETFGAEKVHFLPFEMLRKDREAFFRRLCKLLGVSTYVPVDLTVNESHPVNETICMRRLNPILRRFMLHIPLISFPLGSRFLWLNRTKFWRLVVRILTKARTNKNDKTFEGIADFVGELQRVEKFNFEAHPKFSFYGDYSDYKV